MKGQWFSVIMDKSMEFTESGFLDGISQFAKDNHGRFKSAK